MIIINQNIEKAIIDYSTINIQKHYKDNSSEIIYCVIVARLPDGNIEDLGTYSTLHKAKIVLNKILQSIDNICENFYLMPEDGDVDENI